MWCKIETQNKKTVLQCLAQIQLSDFSFTRICCATTVSVLCISSNSKCRVYKHNQSAEIHGNLDLINIQDRDLPRPTSSCVSVDSEGTIYVGQGVHVWKICRHDSELRPPFFVPVGQNWEIKDDVAEQATATPVLAIESDNLHVEVLQIGALRFLINGPAILRYISFIRDLLLAAGNFDGPSLQDGVNAAARVVNVVNEMEKMQSSRRNGSITGQGDAGTMSNVFRKMTRYLGQNLAAILKQYGLYDVSLSALTEVESEKIFSLIYKFSLHNGTVAMYPEAFTYGLGRAATYIMNTNKTANSFFNPAVNIRSNHAYKAVSRRQPLVLGRFTPQLWEVVPVSKEQRLANLSVVTRLRFIYEKSNRVRSLSKHNINHQLPTLPVYRVQLASMEVDVEEENTTVDEDDPDAEQYNKDSGAYFPKSTQRSTMVYLPTLFKVGDVLAVIPISKKYRLLCLARVRLAVMPEDENIDLDWYDVIDDGDEFITYQIVHSGSCHVSACKPVPELPGSAEIQVPRDLYNELNEWAKDRHTARSVRLNTSRSKATDVRSRDQEFRLEENRAYNSTAAQRNARANIRSNGGRE